MPSDWYVRGADGEKKLQRKSAPKNHVFHQQIVGITVPTKKPYIVHPRTISKNIFFYFSFAILLCMLFDFYLLPYMYVPYLGSRRILFQFFLSDFKFRTSFTPQSVPQHITSYTCMHKYLNWLKRNLIKCLKILFTLRSMCFISDA